MGYDQHMKHWKNHCKDKFLQQCSGPSHEPAESLTEVQKRRLERMSFRDLRGSMMDMLQDLITELLIAVDEDDKEEAYRRLEQVGIDRRTADEMAAHHYKEVRI